jgi:hypothetical protein
MKQEITEMNVINLIFSIYHKNMVSYSYSMLKAY